MNRLRPIFGAAIALLAASPGLAGDDACVACITETASVAPARTSLQSSFDGRERPLHIEIESGLDFSRLALAGRGDGKAEIDPQTGEKRLVNMIDLGGMSYQGRARITGEPLRPVRIELPPRVELNSPGGAQAELTDFVTDLPPVAMLDENGMLSFNFGARISSQGARGGNFRGRINIRVDYF